MNNKLKVFCETLKDPLGVDNATPRFSWRPEGDEFRFPQHSYALSVKLGDREVWSSGETVSANSTSVEYCGEELRSFTEYSYFVTVTLTDGCVLRGEGTFETGIYHADEWQGDFLAYADYKKRVAPVFYTSFEWKTNKIVILPYFFKSCKYLQIRQI